MLLRLLAAAMLLIGVIRSESARAQTSPQRDAGAGFTATMVDRLVRRVVARKDNTLDILILSGGGQFGAYGAGFLQGWQARGEAPMPRFDVVTGISTGSLMAPFAAIGTPAALKTIADIYYDAVAQIGPSFDPLIFIRPTGGLLNRTKLERTIAQVVSPALAGELRAVLSEDRQLLIGTTDLDRGTGRIWDLTRELDGTPAGLARVHSILVASAAIPGAFAPVVLEGRPHTDGGVTTNLLLGLDIEDFRALASKLREQGISERVRVRLWALVNLTVYPPIADVKTRVKAVRDRANGLMYRQAQQTTLTRFHELAQAVTSGVDGLAMEMRYTAVPDALNSEPGASKLFDTAFMRKLRQVGFERAQGTAPWDPLPVSLFSRPAAAPAQPRAGGTSLVGPKWLAEDIRGGGVLDNLQSSISVAAGKQVTGSAGCNTLRGSADIVGRNLKFSPLATTRKLCPPAVMDQEAKFLSALAATRAFRVEGSLLKFLDGTGSELIRFSRAQ